ncbi:unnamed protein product [Diamesa hyperborea]
MGERRGTKALELWCRRMVDGYEGVRIDNMTTSWRDGRAFCALIHTFKPELINFDELKKDDIYYNNELAFRVAEKYLNIPSLLDPNDMVAYEVPDKLSILTYLSQFYQVFSQTTKAQENSIARLKRTNPTDGKPPTNPPAKMAHVVPKREPCFKCKNPVFLAERLVVGTKLYHRCCLKCARCKTLLTIGSFYETENDGEYVCDVCPDEEKNAEAKKSVDLSSQRLSIAQKIALFEKDKGNVLKKSLSDEEKSKSLNRQNSMTSTATIKLASPNKSAALNSFLSEQVNTPIESDDDNEAADLSVISTSSEDNEVDFPPTVPGNHPTNKPTHKVNDNVDYAATSQSSPVLPTITTKRFTKELTPNMDSEFEDILNSYSDQPEELNESQLDNNILIDLEFDQLMGTEVTNNSSDNLVNIGRAQMSHQYFVKEVKDQQTIVKNDIVEIKEVVLEQPLEEVEIVEFKQMEKEESLDVKEVKEVAEIEIKKVEEEKEEVEVKFDNLEVVMDVKKLEIPESEDLNPQDPEVETKEGTESNVNEILEVAESKDVVEQVESQLDVLEVPEAQSNEAQTFKLPESKDEESTEKNEDVNKTDEVLNIKYPICLNPFGDEEEAPASVASTNKDPKRPSLNPFGSSDEDDGINDDDIYPKKTLHSGTLPKPPRPPLPKTMTMNRMSTNPFGDSDEESHEKVTQTRTPVPTPRKIIHSTTPEPQPRNQSHHNSPGHSFKGSTSSLASSTDGLSLRRKKKKAPPPPPTAMPPTSMINVIDGLQLNKKTPTNTPKKKRLAPTPPSALARNRDNDATSVSQMYDSMQSLVADISVTDLDSNQDVSECLTTETLPLSSIESEDSCKTTKLRLIPLEESLIEDGGVPHDVNEEITYRRKIMPLSPQSTLSDPPSERQWEKMKDNKEAQNRNRQSQISIKEPLESTESVQYLNKSSHGKWKRRKGPAPALPTLPMPQKKLLQMLPLQEIRHELEIIDVQQQGLEKQGVILEKMIRERCEGTEEDLLEQLQEKKNTPEVEDLIMQLFELVNEKNELFRRQAELMYLRRQHRLESEQSEIEYEIRVLMAQPEVNKTDSDKTREEALIARLVEVVQLRNEVIDSLETDRLREAQEDLSIKQRMEIHSAKRDEELINQTPTKLSKKEKKKQKEAKKLLKLKKLDEKDLDTSEIKAETKEKKKKKKFLF